MKLAQENDPILKVILTWKSKNVKPEWQEISHLNKTHKAYWNQWDRLTIIEGILYRKWTNIDSEDETLQYVLPTIFKNQVLESLHNDPLAGHLGIKRT